MSKDLHKENNKVINTFCFSTGETKIPQRKLSIRLTLRLSDHLCACLSTNDTALDPAIAKKVINTRPVYLMGKIYSVTMATEAVQTRYQFWICSIRILVSVAFICSHGLMGHVIEVASRDFCLCGQCFGYVRL